MLMMIQIDVIIIVHFIVFIGVDVIGAAATAVVCVVIAAIAIFAIQFAIVAFDDDAGGMVTDRCRYGRRCDRYDNLFGFDAGNQRLLLLMMLLLLMAFVATEYGQFH